MNKKKFSRLSIKLILVITGVLLINLFVYTLITVSQLKTQLTSVLLQDSYNISDIIKKSARHSMLLNRSEDVLQIIRTVGSERGVEHVRVYNKLGSIKYSSDTSEIGKTLDLTSEACTACHNNNKVMTSVSWEKMIRFYKNESGKQVMGFINPIKNEPDCSNDACHYHDSNKALLGVLDVIISTERMDAIIRENIRNVVTGSILITLLIALSSGFAITVIVNRPMSEISRGIQEIAEGNLEYHIPVVSHDDLGKMASQFNEMSEKLNKAHSEIKEWNETLGQKVDEKNEELKKIYEQIVQIEKLASLGKLSATVAHELNNPLEGILTYSKLISKILMKQNISGQFDAPVKYLALIADEAARCGRIVKDLLLFSHSTEGIKVLADVREIVDKDLLLINHHLEIHKIRLQKVFDKTTVPVVCDVQKIEQALLSIIMNAIEAMPDGGKLTIVASKDEKHAIVLIKDEGHGINPKDLPNIFEPFFTTKQEVKGTGLGLSVSYGIILQHKGMISVEESSHLGTTFKVVLPLDVNGRKEA